MAKRHPGPSSARSAASVSWVSLPQSAEASRNSTPSSVTSSMTGFGARPVRSMPSMPVRRRSAGQWPPTVASFQIPVAVCLAQTESLGVAGRGPPQKRPAMNISGASGAQGSMRSMPGHSSMSFAQSPEPR
ncbi:MAG: hypothetical protein NTX64_14730 [Elusimicrobia bacterium]|nr:hypothetical protein [Elusimicrobiota bacterium]